MNFSAFWDAFLAFTYVEISLMCYEILSWKLLRDAVALPKCPLPNPSPSFSWAWGELLERHEKYKCSCTERGSDVMKRSVQTRTFRNEVRRTTTSDNVDVEHFCEEEALALNCSGTRRSRRVHVMSQMGSVTCFMASCDTGLKLSRRW